MGLLKLVKIAAAGMLGAALIKVARKKWEKTSVYGKVVLITGGSRGLGFALAQELADRGALLALCGRSEESLKSAQKVMLKRGVDVFIHPADVTDSDQVAALIQRVMDYYGRIDILINNAGAMLVGPQEVMDVADYKKLMETNCWSCLYTTQAVLPHFATQASGQIVNIASIGGKIAVPHMLPYSVSKFALVGLSKGLAGELASQHVHVSTVIPSLMRTGSPMHISVKGDHKKEYAWFKIADSLPFVSQGVDRAARDIVDGIESKKEEIVLTLTAKLAIALQALCPHTLAGAMAFANRLMPPSSDRSEQKGYESESIISRSALTNATDKAAKAYNQL